jgi:cytochrome P450
LISNLFIAGTDTTASKIRNILGLKLPATISWMVIALANNPQIQKKVHDELDQVLHGKPAVYSDKEKLPYLSATLKETMRWRTVVPLSLFHAAREDLDVKGYFIPKDTIILPCLWAVHVSLIEWT